MIEPYIVKIMATENKKVFINGMFSSLWLQYVLLFIIFVLLTALHLLKDIVFQSDAIDIYYLIRKIIIFFIGIIVFRQIWVFKIETDTHGISYYGFLKKVRASWNEVVSIDRSVIANLAKVKTVDGNFYFPLMMKEKDKVYPKLKTGLANYKWVYENGVKETIALENCPLYIEIQKHYKQKLISKTYRSDEIIIAIFFLAPLFLIIQSGLLYVLIKNWIRNDFSVVLFLAIMSFVLIGFVIFIFFLFRKYSAFKIVTDDTGIAFYGLFKKIYARWQDIISISKGSPFMRERVALVKTRNGDFFFPLSIKGDTRTDLEMRFSQKTITPENCPLYIEIQKHLGNK